MEDELPTLRCCLRFGMLIREQALANEEEKGVKTITREVYEKVISLYMKANAKLVSPTIMGEDVAVQKFVRRLEDIDTIVRRQKGSNKVEERITPELDRLFDLMYCQCTIICVQAIIDKHDKCSHSKLRCCDKEINCILDNCSHVFEPVLTCSISL